MLIATKNIKHMIHSHALTRKAIKKQKTLPVSKWKVSKTLIHIQI